MLLADGKVPAYERSFYAIELSRRDEISVQRVFTDYHYQLSCRFADDAAESLVQASHIAEALDAPPNRNHAGVFEVFEVRDSLVIVRTRNLTP